MYPVTSEIINCLFNLKFALVITFTPFSTPALIVVVGVVEFECVSVWKYGPGSSGAVLIISAALRAAALIVLNAYVREVPSLPLGTPCIVSSPIVLTFNTVGLE